jgi:hypothetical protein
MEKIGPREAAATIRADFENEHADPRFLHHVRFAGQVCDELGVEKSPENIAKVMRLLGKAGIEGHAYNDFPKWVENERGERGVVTDEDHEKAFMERPPIADENGVPNPEHGHVDPNTGVFVAGMKPVVYDDDHRSDDPPPFETHEETPFTPAPDPSPAKVDATT